jgi:sporulation protein YabP
MPKKGDTKMSMGKEHQFSLINKEDFKLKGVTKVETFDDSEIVLATNGGPLILKGENLHINNLDLETGDLSVLGLIKSIQYLDAEGYQSLKGKSKGIIKRLLK